MGGTLTLRSTACTSKVWTPAPFDRATPAVPHAVPGATRCPGLPVTCDDDSKLRHGACIALRLHGWRGSGWRESACSMSNPDPTSRHRSMPVAMSRALATAALSGLHGQAPACTPLRRSRKFGTLEGGKSGMPLRRGGQIRYHIGPLTSWHLTARGN
jgi:hypothetical protein